jgi:hypothetical protein
VDLVSLGQALAVAGDPLPLALGFAVDILERAGEGRADRVVAQVKSGSFGPFARPICWSFLTIARRRSGLCRSSGASNASRALTARGSGAFGFSSGFVGMEMCLRDLQIVGDPGGETGTGVAAALALEGHRLQVGARTLEGGRQRVGVVGMRIALVAADMEAGEADAGVAQGVAHRGDHRVAGGVPHVVVDPFEAVEVDQGDVLLRLSPSCADGVVCARLSGMPGPTC